MLVRRDEDDGGIRRGCGNVFQHEGKRGGFDEGTKVGFEMLGENSRYVFVSSEKGVQEMKKSVKRCMKVVIERDIDKEKRERKRKKEKKREREKKKNEREQERERERERERKRERKRERERDLQLVVGCASPDTVLKYFGSIPHMQFPTKEEFSRFSHDAGKRYETDPPPRGDESEPLPPSEG